MHLGNRLGRSTVDDQALLAAQRGVLLALALSVPILFDPHTANTFNVPKLTALVVGASAILVLAGVSLITSRLRARGADKPVALIRTRIPMFELAVAAVLSWTLVATVTSLEPSVSVLRFGGSYDGLTVTAALAVVALATRHTYSARHVPALLGALYSGGALSILYGLVQLHDRLLGGSWDPVHWGRLDFPNIFSTFGNPNHFGGFLAIVLPLGVAVFTSSRRRVVRALVVIVTIAGGIELAQTASRGAWLAAAAGGAVLGLAASRKGHRHRHRRFALIGAIALMVVVVGALGLSGQRFIGSKIHHLTSIGASSSVGIRMATWQTGARIAYAHPWTGTGPDTFQDVFPTYETARFAQIAVPEAVPNGAHNVFVDRFSDEGIPGLAAFVGLLGVAASLGRRAWRRGLADRAITASVLASLTAWVVQASFDVGQVGLLFSFWLLIGILAVLARTDGVGITAGENPTPIRNRLSTSTSVGVTVAVVALVTALAGPLTLPFRADRAFATALCQDNGRCSPALSAPGGRSAILANFESAVALAPWDPVYRTALATDQLRIALGLRRGSAASRRLIANAVSGYRKATGLAPRDALVLDDYARALLDAGEFGDKSMVASRHMAVTVLRRATELAPHDVRIMTDLRVAQTPVPS